MLTSAHRLAAGPAAPCAGFKALPTNDQFSEDGIPYLATCRIALASMHMTKAQLMEMFKEDGDAMGDMLECMDAARHVSKIDTDRSAARDLICGCCITPALRITGRR